MSPFSATGEPPRYFNTRQRWTKITKIQNKTIKAITKKITKRDSYLPYDNEGISFKARVKNKLYLL